MVGLYTMATDAPYSSWTFYVLLMHSIVYIYFAIYQL
jgi:hypothetical protein